MAAESRVVIMVICDFSPRSGRVRPEKFLLLFKRIASKKNCKKHLSTRSLRIFLLNVFDFFFNLLFYFLNILGKIAAHSGLLAPHCLGSPRVHEIGEILPERSAEPGAGCL